MLSISKFSNKYFFLPIFNVKQLDEKKVHHMCLIGLLELCRSLFIFDVSYSPYHPLFFPLFVSVRLSLTIIYFRIQDTLKFFE